MKEIWLPIPGIPGYSASNRGRIRSEDRLTVMFRRGTEIRQISRGKILKLKASRNKYLMFWPVIKGKNRPRLVHRMVWSAFNGEIAKGMTINHLDKDVSNNSLGNIHQCTQAQNNALSHFPKNKCTRGHALPTQSVYGKKKQCRECKKINWKNWYARNKRK